MPAALIVLVLLVGFRGSRAGKTIRIVPQARAGIVERFGKYKASSCPPGWNIVVPFVDKVRYMIDLREQVVSLPAAAGDHRGQPGGLPSTPSSTSRSPISLRESGSPVPQPGHPPPRRRPVLRRRSIRVRSLMRVRRLPRHPTTGCDSAPDRVRRESRRPRLGGAFAVAGQDLNLRPPGYEPGELPGCSTPRRAASIARG